MIGLLPDLKIAPIRSQSNWYSFRGGDQSEWRTVMKGKTHSTEEIIRILRQADGGETAQAICREHNISEQTFYRWKKKYGDMELADAKRLKALEKENAELKKMLAESMLENRVLKEVNSKKW